MKAENSRFSMLPLYFSSQSLILIWWNLLVITFTSKLHYISWSRLGYLLPTRSFARPLFELLIYPRFVSISPIAIQFINNLASLYSSLLHASFFSSVLLKYRNSAVEAIDSQFRDATKAALRAFSTVTIAIHGLGEAHFCARRTQLARAQ